MKKNRVMADEQPSINFKYKKSLGQKDFNFDSITHPVSAKSVSGLSTKVTTETPKKPVG